jgi:hypothetical protein
MRPQTRLYLGTALYGLSVLVGIAALGFALAPALAVATGLFAIDVEAQSFFSLLTLKGAPVLLGLGAASGSLYPLLAQQSWPLRVAGFALNVLLAWSLGAAIALWLLG